MFAYQRFALLLDGCYVNCRGRMSCFKFAHGVDIQSIRPGLRSDVEVKVFFWCICSGCGVKKVSLVNMKASQYVPIHSKQIRGLSFSRENNSLLLSAALDNTVKLTR